MAASSVAASATLRHIGPAVSWVCEIGMMPTARNQADRRLDSDQAAHRRWTEDRAVGLRADRRRQQRLAETPAPVPAREPQGLRSRA